MTVNLRIITSLSAGVAALLLLSGPSFADDQSTERTWSEIRSSVIGERVPEDAAGRLVLGAPMRAEDAAIVPIEMHLRLPKEEKAKVIQITLVVDENPAPIVGVFHFENGQSIFDLATRVRIASYSFVRAIATMDDGHMYMAKVYVKAAGGCSAPAVKDPAEAQAHLGEMRFRVFADRGDAQIQMRHPNYSGMQMDQVTRLYTPAWFVERINIRQGEKTLFTVEGGISISEDPTFRFSYNSTGEPVTVEAKDNEGRIFKQTFLASGT